MDPDQEKAVPATKLLEGIKNAQNSTKSPAHAAMATAPATGTGANAQPTAQIVARAGDKATPVFISYQSAFVERATKLKRAVEARGILCWMATDDMVGNVQDAIGDALTVASAMIICFSHTYRQSVYELQYNIKLLYYF